MQILIIHLKRFQFTSFNRKKLNSLVDFPVRGLSLASFVRGPSAAAEYDLFAVSNHMGDMGGGHCTIRPQERGTRAGRVGVGTQIPRHVLLFVYVRMRLV